MYCPQLNVLVRLSTVLCYVDVTQQWLLLELCTMHIGFIV